MSSPRNQHQSTAATRSCIACIGLFLVLCPAPRAAAQDAFGPSPTWGAPETSKSDQSADSAGSEPAPPTADRGRAAPDRGVGREGGRPPRRLVPIRPTPDEPGALAQRPPSGVSTWWRTGLALGGVVGLIVVLGGVTRIVARGRGGLLGALGAGGNAPAGVIEILGRYPVGRGQSLVLLKLDRRVLLLSQGVGGRLGAGGGFKTLCEVTDADEVASILLKTRDERSETLCRRFNAMLHSFDGAHEQAAGAANRRVQTSPEGDRVELWGEDANGIPVVEVAPGAARRAGLGSRARVARGRQTPATARMGPAERVA